MRETWPTTIKMSQNDVEVAAPGIVFLFTWSFTGGAGGRRVTAPTTSDSDSIVAAVPARICSEVGPASWTRFWARLWGDGLPVEGDGTV